MFTSSNDKFQRYLPTEDKAYNVSGKVMLSAVVILMLVVALVVLLHLYARWLMLRTRRTNLRRHGAAAAAIHVDLNRASQGLDPAVVKLLPVFQHAEDSRPIDCAVCLSEFEAGESGRTLPKCHHSFHTECIDMWFYSHSTCPLCRATVERPDSPRPEAEISGSKNTGCLSISLEASSSVDHDPPGQIRSPVGRILSMILSREKRPTTPSSAWSLHVGCSSAEGDIESGLSEGSSVGSSDGTRNRSFSRQEVDGALEGTRGS